MTSAEPNLIGLFSREPKIVALKGGEVLFRRGDPAASFFVVLEGELRVGDGNATFGTIGAGSIVGEMALIDKAPRSATVMATCDAQLAEIDEKRFLYLVERTPHFSLNVMRILSQRLRRLNDMIAV